jgi:hypothetical protein
MSVDLTISDAAAAAAQWGRHVPQPDLSKCGKARERKKHLSRQKYSHAGWLIICRGLFAIARHRHRKLDGEE